MYSLPDTFTECWCILAPYNYNQYKLFFINYLFQFYKFGIFIINKL